MVHEKKCPLRIANKAKRRGNPTTEFYLNEKPQIYCFGYTDENDTPLPECAKCKDWVWGAQCEADINAYWEAKYGA